MNLQEKPDYLRIAEAIEYMRNHSKEQLAWENIAEKVGLTPVYFQRMFTDWAGVSPKGFLQYTTIQYLEEVLEKSSLSDAAFEAKLSEANRLNGLLVHIEEMKPEEYKNGGESLSIHYDFVKSPFGDMIVATTAKGICYMAFVDGDKEDAVCILKNRFPNALYFQKKDMLQQHAASTVEKGRSNPGEIKLHLKGSDFQMKVWNALLKIPMGRLTTYGHIAEEVGEPKAFRAVGTAIGNNPVALLIPCHRVIRATGELGGYHWGLTRKAAIIGWETTLLNGSV